MSWSGGAGADAAGLRADLEARHSPGPYYDHLICSDHRCWLLTNHRTDWLIPRLELFALQSRFERIIVSDVIGAAKPSRAAFAHVIEAAGDERATLVDNKILNVRAARESGLNAVLADGLIDWASVAL